MDGSGLTLRAPPIFKLEKKQIPRKVGKPYRFAGGDPARGMLRSEAEAAYGHPTSRLWPALFNGNGLRATSRQAKRSSEARAQIHTYGERALGLLSR